MSSPDSAFLRLAANGTQNPESHMRWTGPQLLTQLPEINIFAAGMGSAGKFSEVPLMETCYILTVTLQGVSLGPART